MKSFFPIGLAGKLLAAILALSLVSCGSGDYGGSTAGSGASGASIVTGATGATGTTGVTGTAGTGTTASITTASVFGATLTGAQEIPTRPSTATATGVVLVDPATRLMRATVTTAGIVGINAHIHIAPPGTLGPIAFPLTEATAGSGVWSTETTLTTEQLTALAAGAYYFNVHSAAFPDGEIRGQILPLATATVAASGGAGATATGTTAAGTTSAGGTGPTSTETTVGAMFTTFVNVLDNPPSSSGTSTSGTSGTNASGSTSGAAARAAVGVAILDTAGKTVNASITTLGIGGSSAHIHQAIAGATGTSGTTGTTGATGSVTSGSIDPVVATLSETGSGTGIWHVQAMLTDTQISAMQSGEYYFDVHSVDFPSGAIRAQIPQSAGAGATGGSTGTTGTTGAGAAGAGITMGPSTTGTIGAASAGATGSIPSLGTTIPTLTTGIPTLATTGTGMTTPSSLR